MRGAQRPARCAAWRDTVGRRRADNSNSVCAAATQFCSLIMRPRPVALLTYVLPLPPLHRSRTAVAPLERLKILMQVQGNEKIYRGVAQVRGGAGKKWLDGWLAYGRVLLLLLLSAWAVRRARQQQQLAQVEALVAPAAALR